MATRSPAGGRGAGLQGRRDECEALDRLIQTVEEGKSRALIVRGEPGVGKTVLLEYTVEQASGWTVLRTAGVQSQMELPFAALHQLLTPMLDLVDASPVRQRDALRTALGMSSRSAPDRFLVGLAVLGVLSEAARERPLMCVLDDEQWLDRASAQVLAFVARRLAEESVGVVFAARKASDELAGVAELLVAGLHDDAARGLLESVLTGPLDVRVRDQMISETRGNPLALLELARSYTPAELAGGFGLPAGVPPSRSIEQSFRRQIDALPAETGRLLRLASADPVGDPSLVWRAAERLGVPAEAATPAADAGLLEFGARVRFRHPLARSVAYRSASLQERQEVHRALADVTDPELDPDRRAWHRAHAAAGPDEDVARELERSAGRAHARGGLAASAAFLEHAARLTPGPELRARRALAAAQAKHDAGAPAAASALLSTAQAGPLDELQLAEVDLLRARIAFAVDRGGDAPLLLHEAARRLEPLDVGLARETHLDALSAALFSGRLTGDGGVLDMGAAARAAPPPAHPPRAADLLLDGVALQITEGYAAGAPVLERALSAFRSEHVSAEEESRWLWLACRIAVNVWDDGSWLILSERHVQLARDTGALTVLPLALSTRIAVHLSAGELAAAASLAEEQRAVTEATGSHLVPFGALALAATQGREGAVSALIESSIVNPVPWGDGMGSAIAQRWSAVLYNGLGRHQDALAALRRDSARPEELLFSTWVLPELVEAAARSGDSDRAADALRGLSETTRAAGTDWALGIEARSRALLAGDDHAEDLYREAIDRLGRTRARIQLARAHLLYGEWLRRERRRIDAREQLRAAHEMLTTMGADAFADRAGRELLAAGEAVRTRTVETRDELTAQEALIARLARDGLSNPQIGTRLFISPRTVKYHLHKVFTKLDISSRNQLDGVLPTDSTVASPP